MIVFASPQPASGKTVLAANLAFEIAKTKSVCLVDADFDQPSQHLYFSLTAAPASLNALCRLIDQERFAEGDFEKLTLELAVPAATITLVAGSLNSSISEHSFETLLEFLALKYDVVIVDLGVNFESKAALSAIALNRASKIIATCLGDPVSVSRFISNLENFSSFADFEKVHLLVNRVRDAVLGKNAEAQLTNTLHTHTPFRVIDFVPEDAAFDQAIFKGVPLAYATKKSTAQTALAVLAPKLVAIDQ